MSEKDGETRVYISAEKDALMEELRKVSRSNQVLSLPSDYRILVTSCVPEKESE